MPGYGNDNKNVSDSQRKFNEGKLGYTEDTIVDIVRPSRPNVSASKGLEFCPRCKGTMYKSGKLWQCTRCGYDTDDPAKYNPLYSLPTKRKTYIDLIVENKDLKINEQLSFFGYVNLRNNYVLVNAEIKIYFGGAFIKSVYADEGGYFESSFQVNIAGKQEIKAYYEGDYRRESSAAKVYVNVTKQNNFISKTPKIDNQVISDLERIGDLYERGLLTTEEFEELKRKLIG